MTDAEIVAEGAEGEGITAPGGVCLPGAVEDWEAENAYWAEHRAKATAYLDRHLPRVPRGGIRYRPDEDQ
ncbi:hypothetical protein SEA_NUBI_78 [Gordonia phage Nubi]|uniref:Uncharacterized protein n=1 Tax=Gordonia phage Nubi TaxID=2588492 RepID=A0A514CXJ3_9CAUD|nr:hypothetical protein KNU68_gp78 [Gordonia phage Nubi]QDH85211.1 hypothetical protein SEA_NUBI_78 [Gordonia phage Nubi]